jgi:hypothetical protein
LSFLRFKVLKGHYLRKAKPSINTRDDQAVTSVCPSIIGVRRLGRVIGAAFCIIRYYNMVSIKDCLALEDFARNNTVLFSLSGSKISENINGSRK